MRTIEKETELLRRIQDANLSDKDFRALFWQIEGACSVSGTYPWDTFEHQVDYYLKERVRQ